jgi:nucleotide-binding universal stress UspA family protein
MEVTLVKATLTDEQVQSFDCYSRFRSVVVGVDDTDESLEAARQAAALADPGATIKLVAVTLSDGDQALARAEAELADSPVRVITRSTDGKPWKALREEAAGADLLVVGKHESSRVSGALKGSTMTHILHQARVPVLVAVRPAAGRFPDRVVAAAGPESGHPASVVKAAAAIAARAGSELTLLRVDWSRAAKTPAVAQVIADFEDETSRHVADVIVGGRPHQEIVDQAQREQASLVVVGSRGLSGAGAVRSVSERVAHAAHCSVLVMRPGS